MTLFTCEKLRFAVITAGMLFLLGMALQTCWEACNRVTRPNTFGVGRM